MQNDEKRIAVFIDFENVAMGVRESNYGDFDISLVLKRVVEKGKILVKRAYSDWHRYSEFKRTFHQAAIELIDVPQTRYSGKNSADIRMVVDAMDLSHQKDHIDTFVIVSGDSDFSPLVSKLRENGRYVIGVGVKKSSSDLLVNNCDEFIYYEDLVRPTSSAMSDEPKLRNLPEKRAEALRLVIETFDAMQREGKEAIYGSMVKQTLLRKLPSFNESYYGYPMFSRLLEDAAENKLLRLTKDQKSGGYILSPYSEGTTSHSASPSPTNGDSTKVAAQPMARVGPSQTQVPSLGDTRERSRRSRWGRGRKHVPQPPPKTGKGDTGLPSPSIPALSPLVSTEPIQSEPASEAEPGVHPVSPIVPSEVPPPQTLNPGAPPVVAPDLPEGISEVTPDKTIPPGRKEQKARWGRGRQGPHGASGSRLLPFQGARDRHLPQSPTGEHSGSAASELPKSQLEQTAVEPLPPPTPDLALGDALTEPVQSPAAPADTEAPPRTRRSSKFTQRTRKKNVNPKKTSVRKGSKK